MGKFSRDKGARGEREFYNELRKLLPAEYHDRLGRNGNQTADGGCDSRESMHPFSIEIKRRKNLNFLTDAVLDTFWLNLLDHCGKTVPVLAYRTDRQRWKIIVPDYLLAGFPDQNFETPFEYWQVTISLEHFAFLLEEQWSKKRSLCA